MARLYLMVGLPGCGKTTEAKRLERSIPALRLTPDEWMIPLFGDPEAVGKRDVLEGRLITVAVQVLRCGVDVVLDLGCWARDERWALRALAECAHAGFEMVYLPVDRRTQLERIERRWSSATHQTYWMSEAEVDAWRAQFEELGAEEMSATIGPPPAGWASWYAWAQQRWPSLSAG